METLERHCVKNDGKIAITSPNIDSSQAVGDSRDLNENIPGKDTEPQETVASERYDSSLVSRKTSKPRYGNDEIYPKDNVCNDQIESECETAEIETNSKDHISNNELKPEYGTNEISKLKTPA